jgi:pilus assembly protein CpaF
VTAVLETSTGVDYALVQQLREQVAQQLRAERRRRAEQGALPLSQAAERELGRSLILSALAQYRRDQMLAGDTSVAPQADTDRALVEAVHAAMFSLGRLQPLIADESLSHIDINGCDRVWLHRLDGQRIAGPAVADSDDELIEWVRTAATYSGLSSRPFDAANPWLEVRLPDGSRLCAQMAVVARPVVSIRLYRHQRVLLEDLHARGGFSDQLLEFFHAAVAARMNILVSGETFSGKSTMLRALGNAVPPTERIVTVEHFLELGFEHLPDLHRDVVAMEERLPNAEGTGGVSLLELVERSRRLNPDRIFCGEVIGGEVVALLDAMTQGEDGSMSTIHSRSSKMVFHRLATYALMSPARVPPDATGMLTAGAVDFVVHMSKKTLPDDRVRRHVSSVREVVGWDGSQVLSSEVFATPPGVMEAGAAAAITAERAHRLAMAGYDPRRWPVSG